MQSFIIKLLTCSVTMSVIALFYIVVTPLLAKRYSAKLRYYAWLVIVIGLIIPFRPQFNNAIVKVTVPSEMITPLVQADNNMSVKNAMLSSGSVVWWQAVIIIWVIGMAVFLTYHIVKHYRFMKMVKRWSNSITDGQLFEILQSLKIEMGISKPIKLCLCSCVSSPMMVGLVKPHIILPYMKWDKDELRFIFKHELVHLKRKDLCYKILVLISTSIHWFNPIIYLVTRAIDTLCEISCDAETMQSTNIDTRQHYSETIIRVIKYQSKLKTTLSTNFYGGKKGMKNRISSIMDITRKKVGFVIICIVLIVTVGTGYVFTTNGSSKNQPNNLEENVTSDENIVTFNNMKAWWDTGWYDDEFFLAFKIESDATISEHGIKCWDSDGKEIEYMIDGPSSKHTATKIDEENGFCLYSIYPDGSHYGNLVFGETYSWLVYAIIDGERYESQINSFVLSVEGSRFGQ